MVDYMKVVAPIIQECIKFAGLLVPSPKVSDVKLLSDAEEAGVNSERLVMVRKLLNEYSKGTPCPSCVNKAVQIAEEVEALEKTTVTQEKVLKLQEGLRSLLSEAHGELPSLFEPEQTVQQRADAIQHPSASTGTPEVRLEPHTGKIEKPESGKTHSLQSDAGYCMECIEGHEMKSATEARHAEDRFRTAGHMTEGVAEKIRVALQELSGIDEDAKRLQGATPEVKAGIEKLLDESRWIRKEFGIGGRGLTAGKGTIEDVQELRSRVDKMQEETYKLVGKCPTCLKRIK